MIRLFFPLGSYVVSSILLPHSFLSRNPPCARFFLGTRPHSLHQETLPIPPEGRLPAGMCHLPTTNRPTLIISHVDPPAIRMRPQSSCFLPSAFWHSSGRGTHPSRAPMCVGVLGPRLLLAARSLPHRSVSLLSPSFHLPSAPIPFPYSPFSQPTACPSLGSDRTLSSLSGCNLTAPPPNVICPAGSARPHFFFQVAPVFFPIFFVEPLPI
jgi:hypothetical protein